MELTGFCVKCKEKNTPIQGAIIVKNKHNIFMVKGTHSCGTKMCAMLSKEKAEKAFSEGIKLVQ